MIGAEMQEGKSKFYDVYNEFHAKTRFNLERLVGKNAAEDLI